MITTTTKSHEIEIKSDNPKLDTSKNHLRRKGQFMELGGMEILAPGAIWVHLNPSRAERRSTNRRRVRNKSWITAQTPNKFFIHNK